MTWEFFFFQLLCLLQLVTCFEMIYQHKLCYVCWGKAEVDKEYNQSFENTILCCIKNTFYVEMLSIPSTKYPGICIRIML